MIDQDALRRLLRQLDLIKQELDLMILRTPSGDARNVMTEANIHLMVADSVLVEIC